MLKHTVWKTNSESLLIREAVEKQPCRYGSVGRPFEDL